MKKFLAILLIATIACLVTEETSDDIVLQRNPFRKIGKGIKNVVKGTGKVVKEVGKGTGKVVKEVGKGTGKVVKEVGKGTGKVVKEVGKGTGKVGKGLVRGLEKFVKGASKVVKQAINFLKQTGIWDQVVEKVVELGKNAANAFCSKYGGPTAGELCSQAIDFIASKLNKK